LKLGDKPTFPQVFKLGFVRLLKLQKLTVNCSIA
jgi:hypothetical protein